MSPARTDQAVDQIVRLRRAEAQAPGVAEIHSVRTELERAIGPTLSRGTTARLIGVSQTALDRWVARGDIPSVITAAGKTAIPLRVAVELVEGVRAHGGQRAHPLSDVVRERRGRATDLRADVAKALGDRLSRRASGHHRAELRSLALHVAVAQRLTPAAVSDARDRVALLARDGLIDPRYRRAWDELLALPLPALSRELVADTQAARDLRQSTPFAGVLTDAERREILSLVDQP